MIVEDLQKCHEERLKSVCDDVENIRAGQDKVAKSGDAIVARDNDFSLINYSIFM